MSTTIISDKPMDRPRTTVDCLTSTALNQIKDVVEGREPSYHNRGGVGKDIREFGKFALEQVKSVVGSANGGGDATNKYEQFYDVEINATHLDYETWGDNATITNNIESNVFGIKENLTKVDFHINDTTKNTFGFSFKKNGVINEGDIYNICLCVYTDDDIDKNYTLSIYTSSEFTELFTALDTKTLIIKKGANYFQIALKANSTVDVGSFNEEYQLYFKDDELGGVTFYLKGYCYIGEPNKKIFGKNIVELLSKKADTLFVKSPNLLDVSLCEHGKRFNNASANANINTTSFTNYTITPYISVEESESYYILTPPTSGYVGDYCFFDVDKQWISGNQFASQWSNKNIINAPQNAKYIRFDYYDPNIATTNVMIAQSNIEIPFADFYEYTELSPNCLLASEQINQVDEKLEITPLKDEVKFLFRKEEKAVICSLISSLKAWSGEVGEIAQEVSNSYRNTYSVDVEEGCIYAIVPVSGVTLVVDATNKILVKYPTLTGSSSKDILKIKVPNGGKKILITGMSSATPRMFNIINNNEIVLRKGTKLNYSSSVELQTSTISVFNENAYEVNMSDVESLTLTLDNSARIVGLWISMSVADAKLFEDNTFAINFLSSNDSVLSTFSHNGDVGINYIFSLKKWYFVQCIEVGNVSKIELSWSIEEGKSASLYIYPYAIIDFITIPTLCINLGHWSNGYSKFKALTDNGLKVTITGTLPETESDIAYAQKMCEEEVIDYGIYGNELNTSESSLMEATPYMEQFEYAIKTISSKLSVTDKVVSYGAEQHRTGIHGNYAAQKAGIKVFRNYVATPGNLSIPFSPICDSEFLRITMISTAGYYFNNMYKYGVFGMFSHTNDFNGFDSTNLGYLLQRIEYGSAKSINMRDLWDKYKSEFVIEEYE